MTLKGRLAKMESVVKQRHRAEMSECKGLAVDELYERIDAATDPADQDVIDRIAAHIVKASETPWTGVPLRDEAGEIRYQSHYFLDWIDGLLDGAFSLPAKIPLALLETFDRDCGHVMWRCRECRTGHGNAFVVPSCLVCGGETEQHCLWSDSPFWESQEEYEA